MKLADCPKGPVLFGDQLYIYLGMESPHDTPTPHAHFVRCADWEYVTFNNFAEPGPGRTSARDLVAEPVTIEVGPC